MEKMEKMENKPESGQKKPYKFNIVDFVLIVVIVAAVSMLVYIMLGNNIFAGSEDSMIMYTIEINLIKNDYLSMANLITKGTKIIDSVRTNELGIIQDFKITDAYSLTTDMETGVVKETPYPDHSKVVITVLAKCKKEKAKYVVNGETIMVGVPISFRTPYLVSYGNCTSLVEITEGEDLSNE